MLELPLQRAARGQDAGRAWSAAGITFETDAYVVDEHLIWGATARILENLLERLRSSRPRRPGLSTGLARLRHEPDVGAGLLPAIRVGLFGLVVGDRARR